MEVADVKTTKTKKKKVESEQLLGQKDIESIIAPQPTPELPMAAEDQRHKLDIKMPCATRKQQLKLLTRTEDGQLIFQGQKTHTVITTDAYGFRVGIGATRGAAQLVFNGLPEDLRKGQTRAKFSIGEIVYTVRPMSKHRKVYAGQVHSYDKRGVVLEVLGATGKAQFNSARTLAEGQVIVPYGFCFKTPEQLELYLSKFTEDFLRAKTDYRQLRENAGNTTQH